MMSAVGTARRDVRGGGGFWSPKGKSGSSRTGRRVQGYSFASPLIVFSVAVAFILATKLAHLWAPDGPYYEEESGPPGRVEVVVDDDEPVNQILSGQQRLEPMEPIIFKPAIAPLPALAPVPAAQPEPALQQQVPQQLPDLQQQQQQLLLQPQQPLQQQFQQQQLQQPMQEPLQQQPMQQPMQQQPMQQPLQQQQQPVQQQPNFQEPLQQPQRRTRPFRRNRTPVPTTPTDGADDDEEIHRTCPPLQEVAGQLLSYWTNRSSAALAELKASRIATAWTDPVVSPDLDMELSSRGLSVGESTGIPCLVLGLGTACVLSRGLVWRCLGAKGACSCYGRTW